MHSTMATEGMDGQRTGDACLVGRKQGVRSPILVPGAAGATDAVHMRVDVLGCVEVDHRLDAPNVEASSRYVCRHQNVVASLLEVPKRSHARVLVHVSMDCSGPANTAIAVRVVIMQASGNSLDLQQTVLMLDVVWQAAGKVEATAWRCGTYLKPAACSFAVSSSTLAF